MELINDQYSIGGISLIDLCKEFGTPIYVYDSAKIAAQCNRLKDAFSDTKVQINYACKALSNINIMKLMGTLGAHIDTVSIQEVQLALKAGFDKTG